jgi:methyltransferase (TIGR00027 family)
MPLSKGRCGQRVRHSIACFQATRQATTARLCTPLTAATWQRRSKNNACLRLNHARATVLLQSASVTYNRSTPAAPSMSYLRLFAILAVLLPFAFSVEPGKPSRTAVLTLQMRALGTKVPDPELRNPDTLAPKLFGAREREVLSEIGQPIFADLNFIDAWNKLGGQKGVFIHLLARTRAIDDTVRAALKQGARQVVILGAGYDSRAYRMQEQMRRATVFEVDFPPTQELKKLRIRESLGQVPKNVVFVPIDFTKEDLQTVLPKAGYHAGRKTVFVWEGVSFYLPERDVTTTLRFVAKTSSPGSVIVFDYESERVVNGNHDDTRLKEEIIRLAKWGEPHIFGLPDGRTRVSSRSRTDGRFGLRSRGINTPIPDPKRRNCSRRGSLAFRHLRCAGTGIAGVCH